MPFEDGAGGTSKVFENCKSTTRQVQPPGRIGTAPYGATTTRNVSASDQIDFIVEMKFWPRSLPSLPQCLAQKYYEHESQLLGNTGKHASTLPATFRVQCQYWQRRTHNSPSYHRPLAAYAKARLRVRQSYDSCQVAVQLASCTSTPGGRVTTHEVLHHASFVRTQICTG